MKIWVIVALAMVLTSCSYQFGERPFPKDELTKITETEFGKELLSLIGMFSDLGTDGLGEPGEHLTEDTMVYVVSDDFLIQQTKNEGADEGWGLTIWTKNSHHIVSCSLMTDENLAFDNVDAKEKEDGAIYLEGRTEELRHLAIQLSLEATKLCVAFPYANASDVIDSATEYKDQIDRLTTELDAATKAMLHEQEKAQDLQKLNLELDEELSSSNSRFVLLLVISGIATIAIIIIGVRSRLTRAVK